MKKSTLIRLHLYCGLFTSFYLICLGLSCIVLNHRLNLENKSVKKTWTKQVQPDLSLEDTKLAEDVRDQLGMMGWVPPWEFRKDSNNFHFTITHLAKTSHLNLTLHTGEVVISEIPKGFLAVLHGLHFFNGRIPNSPFFLQTFIVYQWLALLIMFISMILGLWLWLKFQHKTWEIFLFGGLFFMTVLIMMLL